MGRYPAASYRSRPVDIGKLRQALPQESVSDLQTAGAQRHNTLPHRVIRRSNIVKRRRRVRIRPGRARDLLWVCHRSGRPGVIAAMNPATCAWLRPELPSIFVSTQPVYSANKHPISVSRKQRATPPQNSGAQRCDHAAGHFRRAYLAIRADGRENSAT
jgi:hypothetical protein